MIVFNHPWPVCLARLSDYDVIDPSVIVAPNFSVTIDPTDVNLPLRGVCKYQARAGEGLAMFAGIAAFCLSFVIFGTSNQSLSGLCATCCTCQRRRRVSDKPAEAGSDPQAPGAGPIGSAPPSRGDALRGKLALFVLFGTITLSIVAFFAFVPLYQHEGVRNDSMWRDACNTNDREALRAMGLS